MQFRQKPKTLSARLATHLVYRCAALADLPILHKLRCRFIVSAMGPDGGVMLSRRHVILPTAAGVAASSLSLRSQAATPANILVMAMAIDSILGAFDPAESCETANNEACGNIYRKLVVPDRADANKLVSDIVASWQVSKDGLVFTFQLGRGVKSNSGNALTAEDAAFSLHRVVILNKTPGRHPHPVRLECRSRQRSSSGLSEPRKVFAGSVAWTARSSSTNGAVAC
jgi:ABC-type transport system substrate-binding protein